jgi:hypothetical protein
VPKFNLVALWKLVASLGKNREIHTHTANFVPKTDPAMRFWTTNGANTIRGRLSSRWWALNCTVCFRRGDSVLAAPPVSKPNLGRCRPPRKALLDGAKAIRRWGCALGDACNASKTQKPCQDFAFDSPVSPSPTRVVQDTPTRSLCGCGHGCTRP